MLNTFFLIQTKYIITCHMISKHYTQNKNIMGIFCYNNLYFLDHRDLVSKTYKNVLVEQDKTKDFGISRKLFCIKNVRLDNFDQKKRSRKSDQIVAEAASVKRMYNEILNQLPAAFTKDIYNKYNVSDTASVRLLSQTYFESTKFDHEGISGGNNSDVPIKCKVKDTFFLIPQQCRFLCGDVKEQCMKLNDGKYDIIMADPPWWNKYIRRLKGANDKLSYSMMYNEDIAAIPVTDLTSDSCLIAVWCTNSPSNICAVKDLIFPKWGVEYVATWYWLKLTIDMQPLCSFGCGCKKQPYERVIIGRVGNIEVPDNILVASIPSALHSHKPPLLELLKQYAKVSKPQTLELFARYLLPNTTSVGFEPLKWQHISLYEEI